jgi:hypothetical protein
MVRYQSKKFRAVAILLMLAASPLSVTNTFGENDSNPEELRAILTEKVVDGKLKVSHHTLPDGLSEIDLQRTLSIDDQMSWAYVNYESYNKGIVLFDGKASKLGENLLKSSIDKDTLDDNVRFQVIFSGKTTESEKENMFTISLMSSAIKNPEIAQNFKLLQIGESVISSIDSNQEYRNSIR